MIRCLPVPLRTSSLADLTVDDERSFRHVGLYHDLKTVLLRDDYRFRVPESGGAPWDRVLFLNLTFWSVEEQGDVLTSRHIPADVVAHVAWHHLARKALGGAARSVEGLFFGESIASAFDLYLVGRLLGHAPDAEFLETQVPAMAEVAEGAGMSPEAFEELLSEVAREPERAFEDLRALLYDVGVSLASIKGIDAAVEVLGRFEGHRFAPLLHHYELSNWVLFAHAYAARDESGEPARALDRELRAAPCSLDVLEARWLTGL